MRFVKVFFFLPIYKFMYAFCSIQNDFDISSRIII